MSTPLTIGIIGSLILVSGAAYPIKPCKHPVYSLKNWLFAIGGLTMLIFATLNYQIGNGAVFFIFLQALVNVASLFMLSNTPERISSPVIGVLALGLIVWSLSLFESYNTLFFIIGLAGIAIGYAMQSGTFRRNLALTLGSLLIAIFSYIEVDWVFFGLNVFFALFSGWHSWQLRNKK